MAFNKVWNFLLQEDNREAAKVLISLLGLVGSTAIAFGLFLNYQDSVFDRSIATKQLAVSEQRSVSDRFAEAIKLFGNPDPLVRIGGIYSLEKIAQDSPSDHWTIMEFLVSYIAKESPLDRDKALSEPISEDIQAAIKVIIARQVSQDPVDQFIGLQDVSLVNAQLYKAHLEDADLRGANLAEADLLEANLSKANLSEANLSKASLGRANFESANLTNAILTNVSEWTDQQLGKALLCRTKLPKGSKHNPDRDC